jgi:hypothetical protein
VKDKNIKVVGFRKFGKSRIVSFGNQFKIIKPGQFLLAFHPEKDDSLKQLFYVLKIDDDYFSISENTNWEIGDQLIYKGPIGKGFSELSLSQNLLLISLGPTKGGLFSVIDIGIKEGKNIAYLTNNSVIPLPHSIEVLTTDMLDESLNWADCVLIEIDRHEILKYADLLIKVKSSGVISEVLIYSPILCSGESHCMICAIKTSKGWIRSCHDGAVYKLSELEFE